MLKKCFNTSLRWCQAAQLKQRFQQSPALSTRSYVTEVKNSFTREPTVSGEPPGETLNNEERERCLKVLKLEADIYNQEGRRVPKLDFFENRHWDYLLTLKSKSARLKYYSFLWQLEKKHESKEMKKQKRADYGVKRKEEIQREIEENKHIIYSLSHTSMFLRIYDSTINHWQNNRLTRAMQFAPKIVLDCSYDDYMTAREATNAAKQLMLCFADNRSHDDPFDLHFCNVNFESCCIKALKRHIPTMLNPEFPMNVHEESFTKLFPKERLVYLTPHCRTDLEKYNPDDIYIVGAMVDKINNEPLSLAKAKKLGLRMARLPLDRYLQWGSGSGKSLTLNQMTNILLDIKKTSDWNKALIHVPRRKIVDEKLNFEHERNSLYKRAVSFSMGTDGVAVEHKNPRFSRKKNEFNSNRWPAFKDKVNQKLH